MMKDTRKGILIFVFLALLSGVIYLIHYKSSGTGDVGLSQEVDNQRAVETLLRSGCFSFSTKISAVACTRLQKSGAGMLSLSTISIDIIKSHSTETFPVNIAETGYNKPDSPPIHLYSIKEMRSIFGRDDFKRISTELEKLEPDLWQRYNGINFSLRLIQKNKEFDWGLGFEYRIEVQCPSQQIENLLSIDGDWNRVFIQAIPGSNFAAITFQNYRTEEGLDDTESESRILDFTNICRK